MSTKLQGTITINAPHTQVKNILDRANQRSIIPHITPQGDMTRLTYDIHIKLPHAIDLDLWWLTHELKQHNITAQGTLLAHNTHTHTTRTITNNELHTINH